MNTINFKDFQNMKRKDNKVNEALKDTPVVNEAVVEVDDVYRVMNGKGIEVPAALVNAFVKKVKDESGQNIKQLYSEMALAEIIADYVTTNYMTIENVPVSMVLGSDYKGGAQAQAQAQPGLQAQGQPLPQPQAQPGAQAQAPAQPVQPGAQMPAQPGAQMPPAPQAPVQGVQKTAAQIPPQGI